MWNHETRPHMCCDVMEQSGMCLVSTVLRVVRARKVIEPATLHTLTPSHTHPEDTTSPGVQLMRTLVVQEEKKAEVRGGKASSDDLSLQRGEAGAKNRRSL